MELAHGIRRKRKWLLLLVPLLSGLATFLASDAPDPVFTSQALVRISNNVTLARLLTDVVSYETYDKMATQQILIRSRPVLENVAKRLDPTQGKELTQDAYDELRSRVSAEQQSGSNILAIRGSAASATDAIRLTNTVVDAYIETYKTEYEGNLSKSLDLVRARMAEAELDLAKVERSMLDFRRRYALSLASNPGTIMELRERQQEYEKRLDGLRGSQETLTRIKNDRDYSAVVEWYLTIDDAVARSMADEAGRLAMLIGDRTTERNELLRVQTEVAPPVVAVTTAIQNAERRLESQLNALDRRLRDVIQETEGRLKDSASRLVQAQQQPELANRLDEMTLDLRRRQETATRLREQLQNLELRQTEKTDEITVIEAAQFATRIVSTSAYYRTLAGVLIGFVIGALLVAALKPPIIGPRQNAPGRTGQEMREIMALTKKD